MEANKMRQHLLVEEGALLDLASSACQEALAFGVNEHAFERLARAVEYKCQDGATVAGLAVLAERKRQTEAEGSPATAAAAKSEVPTRTMAGAATPAATTRLTGRRPTFRVALASRPRCRA